jgi:uncharacterized protein DUF4406
MKLYLAGPMRGYPKFNFPAFHRAAAALRARGHFVFSPAEKDIQRHGTDISVGNATGSEAEAAAKHGFNLRIALSEDLAWICAEAEGIALLPGWQKSRGAKAEYAAADALSLAILHLDDAGNVDAADNAPIATL